MHIGPFNNQNKAIIDVRDAHVPLTYFNIVKLTRGDRFEYATPGYETCIVPATGQIDAVVADVTVEKLGLRGDDVWDGEPEGVYVPSGVTAEMICGGRQI